MRPDPKAGPGDLTCRELVELVTDYLDDIARDARRLETLLMLPIALMRFRRGVTLQGL